MELGADGPVEETAATMSNADEDDAATLGVRGTGHCRVSAFSGRPSGGDGPVCMPQLFFS